MSDLLVGLVAAMVATNQPAAVSNLVERTTGISVKVPATAPATNDPVELEYEKLVLDDQNAQDEIDKWINDEQKFADAGAKVSKLTINARIHERLDKVKKAYDDFLFRHPDHKKAHLAYGSFLSEIGEEEAGAEQWEKARQLDPKDPAPWNNLANYFGHRSPVKKAFEYYAKAIELDPNESVYYHNFGTTVYLFRKDAKEYFNIDEQQVFDKAMELYGKALKLDPDNFVLAHDIAQTYYGIKPYRVDEALKAWQYAMKVAKDDLQREGVLLHLARFEMYGGHFDVARNYLNGVTNKVYETLKGKVTATVDRKEKEAKDGPAPENDAEKKAEAQPPAPPQK